MEGLFTLLDVGSRGGVDPRWKPFFKNIHVVAIDADHGPAGRIPGILAQLKVIDVALSRGTEMGYFFKTKKCEVSSIFHPNQSFLKQFPDSSRFDVLEKHDVQFVSLDETMQVHDVKTVDFLKLDTQGSELLILEGGSKTLSSAMGVEVEVEFAPIYEGQPLFTDVFHFLTAQGFILMDLNKFYWRYRAGQDVSVGRGRLIFADSLFFKEPSRLCSDWLGRCAPDQCLEKLLIMTSAYQLFDYAIEVIDVGISMGLFSQSHRETLLNRMTAKRWPLELSRLVPYKEKIARWLDEVCHALRRSSWAHADGWLGNTRK